MSNKFSVVIITKNEEKNIKSAIESAIFANEVLVLDSGSTDKTCDIAKSLGARIEHQDWLGFGRQKNKAVQLATNDWVFVLDSDEKITEKLKIEILEQLKNPSADGFFVPRLNYFFGKYIRTCGLYPDYSVRLFNSKKGKFNDVKVHESVQIDGKCEKLKNHMIHLAYESESDFLAKQKKYAALSSKKKNLFKALLNPFWTFINLYVIKYGFLDGTHGFKIALIYAKYTYWKYIR
jgi:glycosyltransferase involved in cell wall biosynthesis